MGAASIPTVEVVGPGEHRVTVAPGSTDDRVGDLADALSLDPRRHLELDGRPVGRHETLARAGVRHGSRLRTTAATQHRGDLDVDVDADADATTVIDAMTVDVVVAATETGLDAARPRVTLTVEAGPSTGRRATVGPGRHVIGRAPGAALVIADPALEPHHAVVEVGADGAVDFLQLTGRVAARIDGEPVGPSTAVEAGQRITLGTTRLLVAEHDRRNDTPVRAALTTDPTDPWRQTLHRTPRPHPRWEPAPVPVPATSPAWSSVSNHLGITAAVCTLIGSVLVAVLMRSPMFLLLGAVGVVAAIGMWVATRISAFRARRRDAAVRAHELEAFTAGVAHQRAARWSYHCSTTPTAVDALHAATRLGADVWCRRVDHADAYRVALGWGPVSWDVAVASPPHEAIAPEVLAVVTSAGRFADATIPLTLAPGSSLAVTGPGADGVVRSLVVQLATWLGPADWRLLVVAEDPAAWDWARWLPHGPGRAAAVVGADDADAQTAVFTAFDDGDHRHVVVVTDRPELLAQRTGALRRFLAACTSAAVVVRVPGDDAVPALCRSVVEIGSVGLARWWPDVADASPESRSMPALHVAGITVADAHRAARSLAGLRDPEDPALAIDALATSITLGALFDERGTGAIDDAIGIAAGWRARGTDPMPTVALGAAADGIVEVDLVRDGPHVLVAGTTGSGKSELLRTLVVSLAARASPDHVTFVLIDYKGGATFDACADLPHTVGVVTDLDDRLAERALCSLDAEVRRRERLLRAVGATDLAAYRSDPARPKLPRLVVVVDEFAALAAELPTFLSSLVGVAQRGRSLGVHLVLATQRPAGVVDDEIRANTNLRLALRLHDVADARDVVGDDAPARFSRGTPGRAMLRLGPAETVVFQSARCTGPARLGGGHEEHLRVLTAPSGDTTAATTELAVLVRSIRNAAVLSDVAAPHRPWLPPLPELLDGGVPLGAVGLIDVPAEQRRVDLRWTPAAGNLALIGALGAGTTTALLSIVGAVLEHGREHVYVIDARGDDRLDALVVAPRCGGVIRPHEGERLGRLLDRLVGELDERRSAGQRDERPGVMLAVDGVAALRAVLDAPLDSSRWEQLVRIISEGAAVGVTCVLTGERPTAMPGALLAACSDRWVFHLDDPTEATGCGVRAAIVPPPIPGRLIVASTGGEAQLAMPSMNAAPRDDDDTVRPPAIGVLARSVDAATMPVGATTAAGEIELVMGIDHATLDVARLAVPPGEHLLVVGPARSGRTTALRRLAESWSTACPEGVVLVVGQRPGHPLVSGAAEVAAAELPMRVDGAPGPVLVVIDDAEHVDDPAIAAILGRRRPGLLVMATGRPVSLRAMYGHWTSIVRRSRLGLAMSACTDTDGDVLGELLPRHRPLPARPGLAYVIDGGGRRLVQLAWRPPVDLR